MMIAPITPNVIGAPIVGPNEPVIQVLIPKPTPGNGNGGIVPPWLRGNPITILPFIPDDQFDGFRGVDNLRTTVV